MKESKKILRKFLNQTYTSSDVTSLSQFIKTREGSDEVSELMSELWDDIENIETPHFIKDQYRLEAEQLLKKHKTKKNIFWQPRFLKYTAMIAVVIFSILAIYKFPIFNNSENEYCEIHVNNGETKKILLPDNSHLILNSGSYLKYPTIFSGKERLIELKGEAFIDVTKDKDHPFIVRLSSGDVRVLGTSFNIKAYDEDEDLTVSVQTGKVQYYNSENQILLGKDDQLIVNKSNGNFVKQKENSDLVKSWTKGVLYFNKMPIQNVFKELERIYACKIELRSKNNFSDMYIYGQHDNQSLESVLNSIKYTTGLKYQKEGNKYIFY